jgi:hypothetical protein
MISLLVFDRSFNVTQLSERYAKCSLRLPEVNPTSELSELSCVARVDRSAAAARARQARPQLPARERHQVVHDRRWLCRSKDFCVRLENAFRAVAPLAEWPLPCEFEVRLTHVVAADWTVDERREVSSEGPMTPPFSWSEQAYVAGRKDVSVGDPRDAPANFVHLGQFARMPLRKNDLDVEPINFDAVVQQAYRSGKSYRTVAYRHP